MTRARLVPCLLAALLLAACDSDSDKTCRDVANCSHGGSDDWLTGCREQNDALSEEAESIGCSPAFDAYFSCTNDRFECHGNQSSFPGCEPKLEAYSACLATNAAGTACFALESKLADCGSADPSATPPTPCTANGDCSARCYLDALPNVCSPTATGLAAFADCASHCVF